MYLSLLRLNPRATRVQRDLRDPHHLHRTIMSGFPNAPPSREDARAFYGVLHRLEVSGTSDQILLYVQSRVHPDWVRLGAEYCVDQNGRPNPAVTSVTEAYSNLSQGRNLRFRLRANPTRKVDTKSAADGTKRNGRRVALYSVEEQIDWLVRKASRHGFALLHVAIAATGSPERIRSHITGRTFQGVLYEGRLVIEDNNQFQQAMANGIGPGKAYGFGLLSVGPG